MLARDARPSTTSPSALLTGFWFLRRTPVDCKLPARCDVSGCLLGAHEYYRRHNIPSDLKISTTESPPSSFSTAETPYNSNRLPSNAKLVVSQRAGIPGGLGRILKTWCGTPRCSPSGALGTREPSSSGL